MIVSFVDNCTSLVMDIGIKALPPVAVNESQLKEGEVKLPFFENIYLCVQCK